MTHLKVSTVLNQFFCVSVVMVNLKKLFPENIEQVPRRISSNASVHLCQEFFYWRGRLKGSEGGVKNDDGEMVV